jgi:PAS domain S-box-containing protein
VQETTEMKQLDNMASRSDLTASPEIDASPVQKEALVIQIIDPKRQEADQALLAAIVASSEDAIVSKDLNGIVTSWNKAAERIYGWKADEIIGRSKGLVIPPDLPNELASILAKIRAGERIEHYETQRLRKDGKRIEVAISVSPIHDPQGRIVGAATIVRDITERKRIERELEQKHAEIQALNVRLRRAMTETHHRVKNNLQVIGALIEMQILEHKRDKIVPVENYRQLQSYINTLAIVHDLLSASIKEEDDAQSISVKAVLDKLLSMLSQTALNKAMHYSIDEAILPSKLCVSMALILNELVTNAFKHGNMETNVLFRVDGASAQLTVSDDGPGFPEGFDPLREAHMGLELVESLVRSDLKGRSTYGNRPEGGGCVVVTFQLPSCDEETA